jgi:hypothetical protein
LTLGVVQAGEVTTVQSDEDLRPPEVARQGDVGLNGVDLSCQGDDPPLMTSRRLPEELVSTICPESKNLQEKSVDAPLSGMPNVNVQALKYGGHIDISLLDSWEYTNTLFFVGI